MTLNYAEKQTVPNFDGCEFQQEQNSWIGNRNLQLQACGSSEQTTAAKSTNTIVLLVPFKTFGILTVHSIILGIS